MKVYGIDVSHHQGNINWSKTASELRRVNANTNPGFVILRVGYSNRNGKGGLTQDKQILNNLKGCVKNNVPMGIYFYSYDESASASAKTAKDILKLIKGYKFDYPIYIDVEYEPFNKGTDGSGRSRAQVKADNTAIIKAALEEFEKAGYYAAVYCSRDFFNSYTNLSELKEFDKWEAAYTSTDTAAIENGLWQYSSKNPLGIAGFGNSLDCDVSYKDYPSIMKKNKLNGYTTQTITTNTEETKSSTSSGLNKITKWNGKVTSAGLNVRTWAGPEYPKCSFGPLVKDTKVAVCDTVKAKDGNIWYYICYRNKYGFVNASYITKA